MQLYIFRRSSPGSTTPSFISRQVGPVRAVRRVVSMGSIVGALGYNRHREEVSGRGEGLLPVGLWLRMSDDAL